MAFGGGPGGGRGRVLRVDVEAQKRENAEAPHIPHLWRRVLAMFLPYRARIILTGLIVVTTAAVTFDSVLSANDEIGVLPWGMVDLPAGHYVVMISPFEAVPLDSIRIPLSRNGEDHIEDFFGGSENPRVVAQYDADVRGN